jgi:hypothetical protein
MYVGINDAKAGKSRIKCPTGQRDEKRKGTSSKSELDERKSVLVHYHDQFGKPLE